MYKQIDDQLGNYKGTLSIKDQKILFELKKFDQLNYDLINEDGYIEIGKHRKKNDDNLKDELKNELKKDDEESVISDYQDKLRKIENNRPIVKFFKQFKQSLIKSSIFNYPLDIELNKINDCEYECLDPRFLLLSFYQLINNKKVTLEEFIDNNCLAIVFVSLSFEDDKLRRLGYSVLTKFKQTICNDTYGTIWRIVLDKLSASLNEDNQLIQPLITSFFVHIIPFLKCPTYSIYENLSKFLQNYPSFRFNSIVNFIFSMLITDDLERSSLYQEVALLMLKNGIKTEQDFILCLNSKIIDFMLINYNSPILFKSNLKDKVLDIFQLITRLSSACKLLCTEKAFILWLNQLIVEENKIDTLNKINQIVIGLDELNCDFYPLYKIELKMIRNVCTKKIDNLFEQDLD